MLSCSVVLNNMYSLSVVYPPEIVSEYSVKYIAPYGNLSIHFRKSSRLRNIIKDLKASNYKFVSIKFMLITRFVPRKIIFAIKKRFDRTIF